MSDPLPNSIDATEDLLRSGNYVPDRALSTALFLCLKLGRPLFLEGEAGVGKTEIAKVLAETLGRTLIRLQCYEGLDVASAVYEWNYPRQMMANPARGSGRERAVKIARRKYLWTGIPDRAPVALSFETRSCRPACIADR